MPLPPHPILVVSYVDDVRTALAATLKDNAATAVACRTFCEAEKLALEGLYSGLLVDLPSIIKSKGEEKIVAWTLANFFPTLRVRALGSVLVPMTMPGSAKQDKSLNDFLNLTCPGFAARTLRAFRRHTACLATIVTCSGEQYRGFTLNLGWGGAFIVDVSAEKFSDNADVGIFLPEFNLEIQAAICWTRPWGQRYAPGIGVSFNGLDEAAEAALAKVLKSRKEFDPDRLIA